MRSTVALLLVMSLAVPPQAHAGGWSPDQHAALDKIMALQNAGDLASAEALAVEEFERTTAPPGFRRAVAKQGRAVAEALFLDTKDVGHLCVALTFMRTYQADLIATEADHAAVPLELKRLEDLAAGAAAPCARPRPAPPLPSADAKPLPEGPVRPPAVLFATPSPRRPRTQIAVGAGLLVASAGLGAGFGGCFLARKSATDRIRALDDQATEDKRALTSTELAEVHTADRRYARLSNTGKALGFLAGLALVAAVVVLTVPPRARARARTLGAGVHIQF